MKTEFCKYNHIFTPEADFLGLVNMVARKSEMEHSSLVIRKTFNRVTIYQDVSIHIIGNPANRSKILLG